MGWGWGWDGMGVGVGVASGESGPWATIYTFLIIIKTIKLNVVKSLWRFRNPNFDDLYAVVRDGSLQ